MVGEGELSLEEEAKALRKGTTKGRRLLLLAVVGHALVLMALVGLPYLRGRHRAEAGKVHLANYVACLLGGDPTDEPGLALPDSAPEHYADAAHAGGLLECMAALEAIPPDDAFWLFPSTRHAESEVRRAVAMARGELAVIDGGSPDQTPERPWLALQRLIAALTLWMEAADVQGNIFDPCVSFAEDPLSVRPEIVPLQAAADASLQMQTHADGIAVLAGDERGISWVRVGAGALDPRRLRRPTLVRDARFLAGQPWVIWAMADESCAPHCARRTMGVARLDDSLVVTPDPVFIAAHPAGSVAQSVRVDDDFVWVAARRDAGVGLVRFDRRMIDADTPANDETQEPAPLVGEVMGSPRPLRVSHLVEARADGLWGIDLDGSLVDGTGRVRAHEVRWLLPAGASIFAGTAEGVLRVSASIRGTPEHIETPAIRDPQVAVDAERSAIAGIAEDTLHIIRCAPTCETLSIPDVAHFRLEFLEHGLVLAHSAGGEIRVQVWNEEGLSVPVVPAPCWSESGGFCAPMAMTSRDGRVVLGGRDGQDLLVIETRDGARWRRLVGLR